MTTRLALQIVITHRDSPPSRENPREAFWARLRIAEERFSDWSPAQFEGFFKVQFGGHLKNHLLSQLRTARDATDRCWYHLSSAFWQGGSGCVR